MQPLPPLWIDREDAGRHLAHACLDLKEQPDTWLLGLPRGGVAVAAAMAEELNLPLASWAVRKLAEPRWPELAIGAVAPGGVVLWAEDRHTTAELSTQERRTLVRQAQQEMARRQHRFGDPAPEQLRSRHLVVVDDGIATGFTARAALLSLRRLMPASLTLAVPVLDALLLPDFEILVERLIALAVVRHLEAVGVWYERFGQLDDGAVVRLLQRHRQLQPR
jgi:putative phosphoribosyl transferase